MSLFSGLKRLVTKTLPRAVSGFAQGGLGGAIGSVLGGGQPRTVGGTTQMNILPSLPALGGLITRLPAILPGAGAVAGRVFGPGAVAGAVRLGRRGLQIISKNRARSLGYVVLAGLVYDTAGNLIGETSTRRMNPLNHRALTRACRRVKSARKICKKVDRLVGYKSSRAPARKAKCR